jgi:hypothetical protein
MKKVAQRAEGVIGVDGGKGVEGKKPGKIDLKKLLKLGVLGAMLLAGVVGAGAEEVKAKILSKEVAGNEVYVLLDNEPEDGLDDVMLKMDTNSLHKSIIMYIRVGGYITYDNENIKSLVTPNKIIGIVLPDGREVNILDIYSETSNSYETGEWIVQQFFPKLAEKMSRDQR